ncbi:MAG: acetyl-CoA C-acyltransferase [Acidobacteria bacterium]|nr:acetyl-CoA C-acyltransferase [Acidobacteriota bacterium]
MTLHKKRLQWFALTPTLLVALVASAGPPEFEMSRSTIDGGGEMSSTGDDFELSGTIGQADAGVMAGDDFELAGGFWFEIPGVTLDPTLVVNDFVDGGADVTLSGIDNNVALIRSQQRADAAYKACRLKEEIVPVEVKNRKGTTLFAEDDHRRPETTLEGLAKLRAAFRKDGIVTAGNASGIVDGAAAVVVTTEKYAQEKKLRPLGRLVSWAVAGVEPTLMGIGPVPATRKALAKAGLELKDIDLIEVNEAFAPQYLAVEKELGLDRERTNVNGGAIALGHPLGATGTRLVLTLLYELRRRSARTGLATACIGGGQGIAVIVEAEG